MSSDAPGLLKRTLASLRQNRTPVTLFLVNSVKLEGIITDFDDGCVEIKGRDKGNLTTIHAIASIVQRS